MENTLAFESTAWLALFRHRMYSLKTICGFHKTRIKLSIGLIFAVVRQADPTFVRVLNEMRKGQLSDDSIGVLKSLDRPVQYEDGILPVELYPVREQVNSANSTRLGQLPGPVRVYKAIDRSGTYLRSNTSMSAQEKAEAVKKMLDMVRSLYRIAFKTKIHVMTR